MTTYIEAQDALSAVRDAITGIKGTANGRATLFAEYKSYWQSLSGHSAQTDNEFIKTLREITDDVSTQDYRTFKKWCGDQYEVDIPDFLERRYQFNELNVPDVNADITDFLDAEEWCNAFTDITTQYIDDSSMLNIDSAMRSNIDGLAAPLLPDDRGRSSPVGGPEPSPPVGDEDPFRGGEEGAEP